VLSEGLSPVLCIGETKEEYQTGLNQEVMTKIRHTYDKFSHYGTSTERQIEFGRYCKRRYAFHMAEVESLDMTNGMVSWNDPAFQWGPYPL